MARNADKIQLPTNSTDISTLVRYLKGIKEHEPLNNSTAQEIFQEVKATGKRKKASGKRDTHTASTLNTYGLIDYIDKARNFVVSPLGNELISMYDSDGLPAKDEEGNRLYCDEEYTIILLKVFSAWRETGKGRDIHPGRIILQLMCDEDLGYYVTEHDVAYFTSNPEFRSDDQYEEIKAYILEFREKYDGIYGLTSNCKAEIFMPTFVRNWHIFEKDSIFDVTPNPGDSKHFILSPKNMAVEDSSTSEEDDAEGQDVDDQEEEEDSSFGDTAEGGSVEEREGDGDPIGLGSSIDESTLYRTLTHYVLTREASICCGILYGYKMNPEQIVFFGAPGTGKSFDIDKKLTDDGVPSSFQSRVIFYPDYTYGDFVGCLRPQKDSSGIDYRFLPGPLTKALKVSFENPKDKVYLIIEEINRGSAAAVFGDLFQLLDRDKSGKSKYAIRNEEMCTIFTQSPLLRPFFADGNVWFPSNFNLLCTMNTADQNVFVLDSAFKRRFHMHYVPIDYGKFDVDPSLAQYVQETDVFAGSTDLTSLFSGTELQATVNSMSVQGKLKRNWPTFATLVNATIDIINRNEGDQISEDKKLGPFYVQIDELLSKRMFADKVLYYLKQDVFKYVDTLFNSSYQRIYRDYLDGKIDVFSLLIPGGI